MSYNMKNKIVVMFAVAFCLSAVMAGNVKAQAVEATDAAPEVVANQPEMPVENAQELPTPSEDDPFGLDDSMGATEEVSADIESPQNINENNARMPDIRERKMVEKEAPAPEEANNGFPAPEGIPDVDLDTMASDINADAGLADVSIDPSAPKSPFEKYGNTILSRVDNELFNQMSEIEKQTTLLNLELKREEVKNRIDALKAQRERARQEELNLEAEREKKARDEELQRQKALLQEQMKLKEKEMELEKIRQAKILNEYMNETLIANQQWVEANGKLTAQVKELQEERKKLIAEIENKLDGVNKRTAVSVQAAEETRVAYERKISNFNKQIEGLKQIINEKENALQNMNAGADNPFATGEMIDQDAVDMSKEYAIMDITGKGDNIVAKIVSQDGTTFIIRKGSVLKGGEVVVNITDKVITFDNHGAKSYLYTGGTVMQYEPTEAFNNATKTPNEAVGVVNTAPAIRNVRGAQNNNTAGANLKNEVNKAVNNSSSASVNKTSSVSTNSTTNKANTNNQSSSNKGIASFSQGMMVK